jgi:hypothetical protein
MAILRTDIIRALDELIANEAGTAFQALAVVLAKQKWPDLIASEWHNDGCPCRKLDSGVMVVQFICPHD